MAIAVICVCFSFILSSRLTYSHIFSVMSNTAYSASNYSWLHFNGLFPEAQSKIYSACHEPVGICACICMHWLLSLYLSISLCARRITILNIICNMIMLIVSDFILSRFRSLSEYTVFSMTLNTKMYTHLHATFKSKMLDGTIA